MSKFQGELQVQQNHVPAAVQRVHVPVVLAPETNQDIPEWGMQSSINVSTINSIIKITVNDLETPSNPFILEIHPQKMQLHDDDPRVLDFVIIDVDICGQHSSSYCRPSFIIT